MKGYFSIREMSEKWGVSERRINQYCTEGRIPGAQKFGKSWAIPEGAEKPGNPRKSGAETDPDRTDMHAGDGQKQYDNLMPLMNTAFQPGSCLEYVNNMEDGPKKDIAFAEYYYFSGHAKEAAQRAELYLTCQDRELRLSACLIYAYANLSVGQITRAKYVLEEMKNTLKTGGKKTSHAKSMEGFIAAASSVLLHLPLPDELPSAREFIPMLPTGVRAFALYVEAHYLYLQKEYKASIGIIETALLMGAEQYPIPAVYLHLAAVMDYVSLKQLEKAEQHLLEAWEIARPDDLIEGFGEHHGLLGGMLEAVLKKKWPDDFRRIIAITYEFSAGWRKIHNPETGDDVADNLTTTEFVTAMLAARNWTNPEIAEHLNISTNTVKWHISQSMKKLHVQNRKELKKYMLR